MREHMNMTCPGCGATMELSEDKLRIICPYCGHSQLVENSLEITKEKIKSEAYVEIARDQLQLENERIKREQEIEAHNKFRKSFLFIFILLFIVICSTAVFLSYLMRDFLPGAVGTLQIILLFMALLTGTGVIHTKREHLPRVLTIIATFLILLFLFCCYYELENKNQVDLETKQEQIYLWPTNGLSTLLPEPPTQYGEIGNNDSSIFEITLYQITEKDYLNYVRECENIGFNIDETTDGEHMRAFNTDGYYLTVDYQTFNGEQIFVRAEAPVTMSSIDWNSTVNETAGKYLPEPVLVEDTNGKVNANVLYAKEKYFTVYLEMSQDQFNSYVDSCLEAGFNKDYSRDTKSFYADNAEGYSLNMRYRGNNIVEIYVDAP